MLRARPQPKGDPVARAERNGYRTGLLNRHNCREEYKTSAEWLAWLAGWRRGQVRFKGERLGKTA